MKIFAAGIATETNTFSPEPTGIGDFDIQRGSAAAADKVDFPSLDLSAVWGQQARARGDEFVFSLMAWAQPSGVTLRSTYEALRDEILDDLRGAMPVDVVLLMLHGAMVADGYEDCEEDIVRRVRSIIGPEATIGVELDLHCHLSAQILEDADIIVTFKEYPHVDINDRAREVFDLATRAKLGDIRPTMALFDCRMIGFYPTSQEPLRGFVDKMFEAERRGGVLSISLGHGFQFGDVPHMGTKVLVVTNDDRELALRTAEEFGLKIYNLRREISFDTISLDMDEALSTALASDAFCVVVADQSDNVGAGAPGDATFALKWLLDHGAQDVAMAIFYDPEVVRVARKAGVGSVVTIRLGGKMGPQSGSPVDLVATVLAAAPDYIHAWPQQSGEPHFYPVGDVVALRAEGIDLIVASQRSQCFSPAILSDLGIELESKRLIIAKSTQHFQGAFAPIASRIIYMSGPGAVPTNPRQITYHRFDNANVYPWSDDPFADHPIGEEYPGYCS